MKRIIKINRVRRSSITDIEPGSDMYVSFTDSGELFINTQTGKQLKISDIIKVKSKAELNKITKPLTTALYIVEDITDPDICFYVEDGATFISLYKAIKENIETNAGKIQEIKDEITTINESISGINKTITDNNEGVKKQIDDINSALDLLSKNTNISFEEIGKLIETHGLGIVKINEELATLTEADSNINKALEEINVSITTIKGSLSEYDQKFISLDDEISNINKTLTADTEKIGKITETLKIKNFSVIFNIKSNAIVGPMDEKIYIEDLIKDTDQKIKFKHCKARIETNATKAISLGLVYKDSISGSETELGRFNINVGSNSGEVELNMQTQSGYNTGLFFIKIYSVDDSITNTSISVSLIREEENPILA